MLRQHACRYAAMFDTIRLPRRHDYAISIAAALSMIAGDAALLFILIAIAE